MGNRAVITTRENFKNNGVGVYLHWNGGRDSVESFLAYCKLKDYRSPSRDCYGWARLCQVIGNFFGGTCSVGIDTVDNLDCDNWDNGVYIIDGWEIVGREFFEGLEQYSYDRTEMLIEIDKSMPEKEQLGELIIRNIHSCDCSYDEKLSNVTVGSTVCVRDELYGWGMCIVLGFGAPGAVVNGNDVSGVPFIDFNILRNKHFNCENSSEMTAEELMSNPNSYLFEHRKWGVVK